MFNTLLTASMLALVPGNLPAPLHTTLAPSLVCLAETATLRADSLRLMYEGGVQFREFLAGARSRKEMWEANSLRSLQPDSSLVAALKAVPGKWRILAVAVDACSDSVNTLPWIAALVDAVDSLDMRIVNSTVGRSIMEAHKTPDGRAATPTLLLLDANWNPAGCFIERPAPLRDWMAATADSITASQLQSGKMNWYEADAGRATVSQIVSMVQGAVAGKPVCM